MSLVQPIPIPDLNSEASIPVGFLTELMSAQTAEQVRKTYCRWSKRLVGCERCSIAMPQDDDTLIVNTFSGKAVSNKPRVFPMEGSKLGEAFVKQQSLLVCGLDHQDTEEMKLIVDNGMQSVAIVPIIGEGRSIGVISTCFIEKRAKIAHQLPLLEVIAQCLSTNLLLIEKIQELKTTARTDALTGVLNRHGFESLSEQVWEDWVNIRRPFTIATFDLDHFKRVNDTHGHAVGDHILQEVSERLQGKCRSGDQVVRMGGEEFCVLLGGVSQKDALPLVKRLHNAVRAAPIKSSNGPVLATTSVGVASVTLDDQSFEACLDRSDKALYRAKHEGRDRVVLG